MIKGLVLGFLVAVTVIMGTSQTSQALHAVDGITQSLRVRAQQAEERVQSALDRRTERQSELDAKRQAIEQRIAERRAAVTEKLSGERSERCEKKELTINQILDNRVAAAEKHFDKLKAIHGKLAAFVVDKELTVDNANALELILNEKQGDAQVAIDSVKALDFDCALADANAPGVIVTDQISETKQALKDYRTAIKDYAVAIRGAATSTSDESSTETTQDNQNQPTNEGDETEQGQGATQ